MPCTPQTRLRPLWILFCLALALWLCPVQLAAQGATSTPDLLYSGWSPTVPGPIDSSSADWQTIISENFEGAFPGPWALAGDPTWDDESYRPHWGGWSAWCAGGGSQARDPAYQDYANDMWAWMIYGPFPLSDATAAELTLWLWLDTEIDYDWFWVGASRNLDVWGGWPTSGSFPEGWRQISYDLSNVPDVGSMLGERNVWIAIRFQSDGSATREGAYVDDIVLRKQVSTPPPTPPPAGCVCESDHPYGDYEWGDMCTLYNPDSSASCTRVHFSRIELGQGAVIRLKQGNGQTYQEIRGPRQATDFWSDCVPGTRVLVELETGSYPPAWGFCIDQVGEAQDTTAPTISNVRADPQAVNTDGCGAPEQVTIYADVTDDQSGVARVELHYQAPGEQWQIVPMSAGTGNTYYATVGPFAHAGTLQAQVRAFDQAGNDAYSTPALEVAVNSCSPPDTTPPMIYNVRTSPSTIYRDGCPAPNTVTISASIIDDQSGLDWARLHYQPPGESWSSVAMPYTQNGSYSASVAIGPFTNDGVLRYYIEAGDAAGNDAQSDQYTVAVDDCCALTPPVLDPIDNADCDADFTLTWSEVPGATEYWIRYADNAEMLPSTDLWPAWFSTSRPVSAPSPGTWYYQVRADTDQCIGDYSNVQSVQVWPVPPQTALQPIINPDQNSSYDVDWLPVADADHYEYMESQNPSFIGATPRTSTATRLSISSKGPGQWYYKVRACNCRDCGPWSVVQSTVVAAQVPVFLGNTSCAWGTADCNRCVNNVVDAFNRLNYRGDVLGVNLGSHPDVFHTVYSHFHQHWQGITRIAAGDGRSLVFSQDNVQLTYSVLGVARLGTRNATGDRFRSNRLLWDVDLNHTIPAANDVFANTVWIDEYRKHPGGIQAMGSIVAVSTENGVSLYDLSNPLQAAKIGPPDPYWLDGIGPVVYRDPSGNAVAMAQLQDGRYLLVDGGPSCRTLQFYVSNEAYSLRSAPRAVTFSYLDGWQPSPAELSLGSGWDVFLYDWDSYQGIDLLTDCATGKLYLLATSNLDQTADCGPTVFDLPCWPDGQDWASLYEIQAWPVASNEHDPLGIRIVLVKVAEHYFDCQYRGETQCNFDAAAGAYVDPQGQLLLYAAEHASDGPNNSIKMMEFRPMPPSPCTTEDRGWVELYEDVGFRGRSLMIDFPDRGLENYANYDQVEDFEDKASSVRWCLPQGMSYVLFQDKEPCGGRTLRLDGHGQMWQIADLKYYDFGDKVSCSTFVSNQPVRSAVSPASGGSLVYNYSAGSGQGAVLSLAAFTEVNVPAGAVAQQTTLSYTPQFPPEHAARRLLSPSIAFRLEAEVGGQPVEGFQFDQPVRVTVQYDGPTVESVVDESTLILGLWDGTHWIDAATTCDPAGTRSHQPAANRLAVDVCRIGEMALLGEPFYRSLYMPLLLKGFPPGPRPSPTPSPTPIPPAAAPLADMGFALGDRASWAVSLADADGDGDLDAFFANVSGLGARVWLNDGQGFLLDSGSDLTGNSARSAPLGDLDGDGDLDVFTAGTWGDPCLVWFNDGSGTFTDSGQRLGQADSTSAALGDLDGDGDLDAYVGNWGGPDQVWLNNGQGTFEAGEQISNRNTEHLALGDVDGDGDLDVVCGHQGQSNRVRINDGSARFPESRWLGETFTRGVALGDLDSDGDLDVFLGNGGEDPNQVWLNDGAGNFTDSGQRLGSANSGPVALGDIDLDGDLDAMVANWDQPCQLWRNDGSGSFWAWQTIGNWKSGDVALGDLDGDGDLDAVVANVGGDGEANRVLWNRIR